MSALDATLVIYLSQFVQSQGNDFVPWNAPQHIVASRMSIDSGIVILGGAASFSWFGKQRRSELDTQIAIKDESFTQMVIRKIQEKEMSNPQCYTKAHIDRRLFSKILSNIDYKPDKKTAFALALALELPLEEAEELLAKAGFAISDSQKFDLIIKYFIRNNFYDILVINEALLSYDQPLLWE